VPDFQVKDNIRIMCEPIVNTLGVPQTGLTVTLRIKRRSDGFYLDFFDNTFKAAGWTTLNVTMTELDATNAQGIYFRDFPTVAHGVGEFLTWIDSVAAAAENVPQVGIANVRAVEAGATNYSLDEVLRIVASAAAGKSSTGPGGFRTRNLNDSGNVIDGTADASGNRTAVTYTP